MISIKGEVAEQDVYQTGGHYLFLYLFLSFMSIITEQKKKKSEEKDSMQFVEEMCDWI